MIDEALLHYSSACIMPLKKLTGENISWKKKLPTGVICENFLLAKIDAYVAWYVWYALTSKASDHGFVLSLFNL